MRDPSSMHRVWIETVFLAMAAVGSGGCNGPNQDGAVGGSGGQASGTAANGTSTNTTSASTTGGFTDATSTGSSAFVNDPSDCEHPSQFDCSLCPDCGCACNPALPASPESCATTADFHCSVYTPEFVTCSCELQSPEKPDDCLAPLQFHCAVQDPLIGCDCVE